MFNLGNKSITIGVIAATLLGFGMSASIRAATAEDLHQDANQSLNILYKSNLLALDISKRAKAVLVFPSIIKAGLVFGGSYGEGVLLENDKLIEYYNSVAGSWGLQAGAQSYGYAMFLMNDKAIRYLEKSNGWEIGVGPTVVVVTEGIAKNLSSSTMKDDVYAFIFDQKGLMLGISIEGTKVSRIER